MRPAPRRASTSTAIRMRRRRLKSITEDCRRQYTARKPFRRQRSIAPQDRRGARPHTSLGCLVGFFGEPYADGIEFLLDSREVCWVDLGFDGLAPFDQCALPVRGG